MSQTLQQFATQVTTENKKVGNTKDNLGECVGLVEVWFDVELSPHVWGNAKDLYANAGAGYIKGTTWPAPAGSAACFDGSWGGGVGHVMLSLGNGWVVEQNNPTGSTPHKAFYGPQPRGYIGWILPENYKGDIMSTLVDRDIAAELGNLVSLREGAAQQDPQFVNSIIGQPVEVVIPALMQSAERHAFVDSFNKGQSAVQQVTSQQDVIDEQAGQIRVLRDQLATATSSSPTTTAPPPSTGQPNSGNPNNSPTQNNAGGNIVEVARKFFGSTVGQAVLVQVASLAAAAIEWVSGHPGAVGGSLGVGLFVGLIHTGINLITPGVPNTPKK